MLLYDVPMYSTFFICFSVLVVVLCACTVRTYNSDDSYIDSYIELRTEEGGHVGGPNMLLMISFGIPSELVYHEILYACSKHPLIIL